MEHLKAIWQMRKSIFGIWMRTGWKKILAKVCAGQERGENIRQPYQGTHIKISATGTVCPRPGVIYAQMFTHSDTEIFKIFLNQANTDIQFQRPGTY
ncbi:MAG TPA: hypothetical protein VKF36_14795 [Syntrophorhabdales bacterium]|nr:hypothetical protein [Syntrophorhabdales bacterium]